jgi:hypothetical protein
MMSRVVVSIVSLPIAEQCITMTGVLFRKTQTPVLRCPALAGAKPTKLAGTNHRGMDF